MTLDRSEIITLIKYVRAQDANGVWRDGVATKRDVFCQAQSVSRNEFFLGGQNGLRPEYVFTVFFGDYDGEDVVEYRGAVYAVYRTYHARTDELEIYVQRKVGKHGTEDAPVTTE